jgi:hypothetical protein
MADWSLPDINELYTDIIDELNARDVDALTLCLVDPTNKPIGAIRWNRGTTKFQEWSGAAWVDLSVSAGLGLGTMAAQNSNNVNITGGTIGTAVNIDASRLTSGTVPDLRFPATLPVASGVNLTALNASNLASGTVPTARLDIKGSQIDSIGAPDAFTSFVLIQTGNNYLSLDTSGANGAFISMSKSGSNRHNVGAAGAMGITAPQGLGELGLQGLEGVVIDGQDFYVRIIDRVYIKDAQDGLLTLEYEGAAGTATVAAFYRTDSIGGGTSGSITATGNAVAYNVTSDRRVKKDIRNTKLQGLKTLLKLKVKDFKQRFGSKREQAKVRTGLIAQEVEMVFPAAVTKPSKVVPEYQLDYSKFVPLLIKSVQELSARVEELEAQIGKS